MNKLQRTISAFFGILYQEPGVYALSSRKEPGALYCFVEPERKCLVLFSSAARAGEFMGARGMTGAEWGPRFFPNRTMPDLLQSYEDIGVRHVAEDPPTDPWTGFQTLQTGYYREKVEEYLHGVS